MNKRLEKEFCEPYVREGVQKYYEEAGWDANGIPKSETLVRLGLGEVDDALKKLRETSMKHV